MAFLGRQMLSTRGYRLSLAHYINMGEIDMTVMLWLDREQRYFICAPSSSAEDEP
jgi:hypothetical protein